MTRRVLFFSGAPGVGGGERAVLPTLARLRDIDLLVAGPAPVAEYGRDLGAAAVTFELPHAHRLTDGVRVAAGGRRVRELFRDARADVLYANGTRAIPYAVAAALFGCRPLLFHHHGLLTTGPVRTLAFAVDHYTDAIVTPSRASAEPFHATDRLHVVPYGIDLERFRPSETRQAGPAGVVGTLTRPDPRKGMQQFLELARRVSETQRPVHFVLGGGPAFPHEEGPYATAVAEARALGVDTTGHVEDTPAFFRGLDVFVHLGEPEGFGLVVAEALASGVPVVAYDWGAIPEVFAGAVTVVPPGNLVAAAAAVQALLDDPERRAFEGRRGRAVAEQRFAQARMGAELGAVIAALTRA